MLIDTHTHLNFKAFKNDWREVVYRAHESGVEKMIVVGTDLESSKKALQMAKKVKGLYASIGIHPHHARGIRKNESNIDKLMKDVANLAGDRKVVAIGEVGLDYHVYKSSKYQITNSKNEWSKIKSIQKKLLRAQVKIASELEKPLIIHSRKAGEDVLNFILEKTSSIRWIPKGVFHCFEGNKQYLRKILENNFYISFTGNITYSKKTATISKHVPLERLLLETDSPFMTPKSIENKRNEPKNVKIVAQKHASLRKIQYIKVSQITNRNAQKLFFI